MSVALSYGNTIIRFGNVAISAGVVSPIYNVSLIQDAHGSIAASPMSGHPNQTVTLSNTPATHYHFDSYSVSGATLTGNQFKLVDQDVTAKGTFVEDDKYNLTLQTNGYGTISASKTTGYAGDTVTLSNTPSADCTFASYAATGATINGSTLTFGSQAATAKANFNRNVHSVTVQNDGHGTVTASPSTGYSGTQVTLNTTPASNYELSGFTITGATLTGNKFNIGTANVTAKAWFKQDGYQYFCFMWQTNNEGGAMGNQLALISNGQNYSGFAYVNGLNDEWHGPTGTNEVASHMVDGNVSTKYMQEDYNWNNYKGIVVFSSTTPLNPTGMWYRTSNDQAGCAGRSPYTWKLLASKTPITSWSANGWTTIASAYQDSTFTGVKQNNTWVRKNF